MESLRVSHPQTEGVLRISKCLKHQVLLGAVEMRSLIEELSPFEIYAVSEALVLNEARIEKEDFLERYESYVEGLKTGQLVDEKQLRRFFSAIFTAEPSLLYAMPVAGGRYLIKPLMPVIQLQFHRFIVSSIDEKFHPMVNSSDSISWGLQFSYPQIYQDPKTDEMKKVDRDLPNSQLFLKLTRFLRTHSIPSPFLFRGKRTNVPIRIGKSCLAWINNHPHLRARGVEVAR